MVIRRPGIIRNASAQRNLSSCLARRIWDGDAEHAARAAQELAWIGRCLCVLVVVTPRRKIAARKSGPHAPARSVVGAGSDDAHIPRPQLECGTYRSLFDRCRIDSGLGHSVASGPG